MHSRINPSSSGERRAFPRATYHALEACVNPQTRPIARLAGILICLLLFQNSSIAARKVELSLPWSELEPQIHQRNVALVLPDGVHLVGRVTDITHDALVLNVAKSSDPKGHPKGKTSIARSAVSVIQLNETKGSKRALWSSVGAGAGLVGGWLLAEGVYHVSGEGQGLWAEPAGVGLILVLAGAGGAIGYFSGRSSDRVETYIKVIPAP
jgi:hypothetical protein